ncbi:MAG: phosphomannomutase/phosphoglucomutase [Acidobacteria bacterium]|nr:phosphomannomutase/phosphoglucomutase [Acidobacteriota bacterium]
MGDLDAIFKAYDIRGVYGAEIDASTTRAIGASFARFVASHDDGGDEIVIGHDMRPSGPELVEAFIEGVTSQGVSVTTIGLCSTDMMYFASGTLDMPGAVFTASHNPAEYNGIKLCLSKARPIGVDSGLVEIKEASRQALVPTEQQGSVRSVDLLEAFADHVRSFVDLNALEPFHVVADTANGMGGLVVPAVFDGLPCRLDLMYGDLDGTFPNHPADPINPENQIDLKARVLAESADIGLAFDGDADRVFLVDEAAGGVSGSLTTALLADQILRRNPGGSVIYNLICSKAVPEVITEAGGVPLRSRVGHSFIKAMMAETNAVFGGEHSAHYYFADNYRADSGLIAAVMTLGAMSTHGGVLSEMLEPFDRYSASGEINTRVDDAAVVLVRIEAAFGDAAIDHLDGLTVDEGDWWFNLRASNTEPLLRLNVEAATAAECAARVDEVRALIG